MNSTLKSQKLAEQIAKLEAERKAAIGAEREADEHELIRLCAQARCLQDALGYARNKLSKRKGDGNTNATKKQEIVQ